MKRTGGALFTVAVLVASLVAAVPGASAAPPTKSFYVVGFKEHPRGLGVGNSFHGAQVERVDPVLHFIRVSTANPNAFVSGARGDSRVRYVEPDPEIQLIEAVPNDPSFGVQYGPQAIRAPQAWDTTFGDLDAKVCVVDTGVRYTHEDLAGARWLGGTDVYNGDTNPMDDNGHGTHVAGTAAATIGNAKGIAGVANVGIYGVKVLSAGGSAPWSTVASGVRWCADNAGPRTVISMSLGGGGGATVLEDAVKYAYGKGNLLVAAAGNSGPCTNCVGYPAKYPEVIAVTCTDASNAQCSFSSDGPESALAGPGLGILSTYHTSDTAYTSLSGTSMSTPHVSGVAALVWSYATGLSNSDLRKILRNTALDLGPAGWDEQFGYGLVDAEAALAASALPPPPEAIIYQENFDDGVAGGWALTGLWHVSSVCSTPPSIPNYLGYNQDATCKFATGTARTTGNATFDIDLTGSTSATLLFDHRFEKETYAAGAYDVMRVQVSTNGGTVWTTLRQWDSRNANQLTWNPQFVDLGAFADRPIKVRFLFDSVDGSFNNFAGWFLDDVEVTANAGGNQSPVASAGSDQTLSDQDGSGAESVSLDGSASGDPDGTLVSYEWREAGNVIATGVTPTLDFGVGAHTVTLTVTDDGGATSSDDVVITVNANQPPVANAGADQTLSDQDGSGAESVSLDGSASGDPDGTLVSYEWREAGNVIATGVTPTLDFGVGAHTVTLTVTDDGGATSSDDVAITVTANQSPVASFTSSVSGLGVSVDGSASGDPDGFIVSYDWDWGDSTAHGSGSVAGHTYAASGTYTITLTVTDDDGATGSSSSPVTVSGSSTLLSENFDDGVADAWTLTGLWHVASACSIPPSTPNYLGYNLDATCKFATGARTAGNATVDVDLTGRTAATLRFDHRFEKENYAAGVYDVMRVQVSTNGGTTWKTLKNWDSRNPNQLAWSTFSVSLTPYVGGPVKVRFLFDSVDGTDNSFAGWFLDNVQITSP